MKVRSMNIFVACVGLFAFIGMLLPLSTLWSMASAGELALLRLLPTAVGALLLLVASTILLLRRTEHGWTFAVAAIALLLGMFWLHETSSFWHWFAVVAAAAGAVIDFGKDCGHVAAE